MTLVIPVCFVKKVNKGVCFMHISNMMVVFALFLYICGPDEQLSVLFLTCFDLILSNTHLLKKSHK